MTNKLQTISQILQEAEKEFLYKELLQQLNKDFNLSGLSIAIPIGTATEELKEQLFVIVEDLIHTNFEGFLNFLYRIDVPEAKVKNLPKQDFNQFKIQVSYLILKREWMKVWYRKNI